LPEGGFAGGEEGVFAGVPAEEMGRAGVGGVVIAGFPDFVEEEAAGLLGAAVKIELQAAVFLAGRSEEGAEFGFEEEMLAFFGAHDDDQGDGVFWEFDGGVGAWPATGRAPGRATRFCLGHDGGDCTPKAGESKEEMGGWWRSRGAARLGRRALQEHEVLAFFGAHDDYRGDGVFWESKSGPPQKAGPTGT
jgi:hypothetical protein